jgi:arginine-tRNA-protein transferase
MIGDIHFPGELSRRELDEYLARGWFRMGQSIFTTDEFPFKGNWHTVHWLRLRLQEVNFTKSARKILGLNKELKVSVQPLQLTNEIEELYTNYRNSVEFDPPESVAGYLSGDRDGNIYDTQVIEVRDGQQLVAAGIFDRGENSIAGIMNFYHPGYRSKSLGKYLMLLKIQHAKQMGTTYYYPGYIARGFSKFDYKIFPDPGATEVYDSQKEEWIDLAVFLSNEPARNDQQGLVTHDDG